jgi:hypothetical protein
MLNMSKLVKEIIPDGEEKAQQEHQQRPLDRFHPHQYQTAQETKHHETQVQFHFYLPARQIFPYPSVNGTASWGMS